MKWAENRSVGVALGLLAFACAAVGAEPYAASWNDGSRLATVESLLERRTLAIEDSIFVLPQPELLERGTPPYKPATGLNAIGTMDRLLIHGHFYSDKPAVISLLMAATYEPLMWLGAPKPSERPDVFCRTLTRVTAGGSFAFAVVCLWLIGGYVGLSPGWRFAWLGVFAFGTFAFTYTRHVNNHIMQLAIVAGVCAVLARAASRSVAPGVVSALALGLLAGVGFNLDFGNGPLLVGVLGCYLIWRTRRASPVLAYSLAAVPWVVMGLWINYAIGGVLKPMNMVPEYSYWPGSPFDARNLTGFVRYGPLDQARYLYCMLFGSPGFFTHNIPLFLALAASVSVLRKPFAGRGEIVTILLWCVATWLMYGFLSNNYSGKNVSIRWFVPFLAPGFWLLAIALRDQPALRPQFVLLAGFGLVLGALMWSVGPWAMRLPPLLWPITGTALAAWGTMGVRAWRANRLQQAKLEPARQPLRLAA